VLTTEEDIKRVWIAKPGGELTEDTNRASPLQTRGLATGGVWGNEALGVIRGAVDQGKHISVIADETSSLYLQGARPTAWELMQDDIPVYAHHRQHERPYYGSEATCRRVVGQRSKCRERRCCEQDRTCTWWLPRATARIPLRCCASIDRRSEFAPTGEEIPIEESATSARSRI